MLQECSVKPGAAQSIETHKKSSDHLSDLEKFLKHLDSSNLSKADKEKFDAQKQRYITNFAELDKEQNPEQRRKNVELLRRAGVTKEEDLKNPLLRHTRLSTAYLERQPGDSLSFTVNFRGNDMAEWRVGASDMLPNSVYAITIQKGGETVNAIRARNPNTGRIGFYEANALSSCTYDYVAVHTGDIITITETRSESTQLALDRMKEHVAIYQEGAMTDGASDGEERRYDAGQDKLYGSTQEALRGKRRYVAQNTRRQIRAMRGSVQRRVSDHLKINEKFYKIARRKAWRREIGHTWELTKPWITKMDPLDSGTPLTFLGAKIPDGMNRQVIPYLKEAEARIQAKIASGEIKYNVNSTTSTYWRNVRGGKNQSYHSWGVAIDINPGSNPLGATTTDIPPAIIQIMKECGFIWGGDWKGRKDPMHFEFKVDPETSTSILRSEKAKQYMKASRRHARKRAVRIAAAKNASQTGEMSVRMRERMGKYDAIIREASRRFGIPAHEIRGYIYAETDGIKTYATSSGRGGLMLLSEADAKKYGLRTYPLIKKQTKSGRVYYRLNPLDDRADAHKCIMAGINKFGKKRIENPNHRLQIRRTRNARKIAEDHNVNAAIMKIAPGKERQLRQFWARYERNKRMYNRIAAKTDFPPILIAIIHYRENGLMKFNCYLHNGQALGKVTTVVPKGVKFKKGQFYQAALHALGANVRDNNGKASYKGFLDLRKKLDIHKNTTNKGKVMAFAEFFNGLGYRLKGRTSAYAYAGTNLDMGGMYTRDRHFDINVKDQRLGAGAIMLEYDKRTA